jgi:hypothetical protein
MSTPARLPCFGGFLRDLPLIKGRVRGLTPTLDWRDNGPVVRVRCEQRPCIAAGRLMYLCIPIAGLAEQENSNGP